MRQPTAMTGDSSEFLKGQIVVQRFRPRDFGDLGAAAYAASRPSRSAATRTHPFPVSYVTDRPVRDLTRVRSFAMRSPVCSTVRKNRACPGTSPIPPCSQSVTATRKRRPCRRGPIKFDLAISYGFRTGDAVVREPRRPSGCGRGWCAALGRRKSRRLSTRQRPVPTSMSDAGSGTGSMNV